MRFLSLGFVLLTVLALNFCTGCSASVHSSGLASVTREASVAPISLFPADQVTMPDEDISRILDTPWYIPDAVRVAVVCLGHDSEFDRDRPSWLTGMQSVAAGEAIGQLQEIPVVYDASYLPSFLLPERRTVPQLRQAAVRYQADWVLIYNTRVRSKVDRKFLKKDEVQGICQVECALLDVRSGLITFTGTSTRDFRVKEEDGGEPMALLVARAEQDAVDAALHENTVGLGRMLARLE